MKIPLFFTLLLCVSCNQSPSIITIKGVAMTVPFEVQAATDDVKLVQNIVEETFAEIDQIYNNWNDASEISKLNVSKTPQPLSHQLYRLLLMTDLAVHLSDGRFDPTIEPIQQLWKKSLNQGSTPTEEEIAIHKDAIGWSKVHFDENTFWKDNPDLQLDLGGIAKGYAVDLLFERLQNAGIRDLYVEWGGEIKVSEKHPSGRSWNIAIKNLDMNTNPTLLTLSAKAIATSGDYEQNWSITSQQGKKTTYFHVIDPETLSPLQIKSGHLASVTVVGPSCALADALATAALFLPLEEAKAWTAEIKKRYPVEFYFVERNSD